jgi:hypothetical protein
MADAWRVYDALMEVEVFSGQKRECEIWLERVKGNWEYVLEPVKLVTVQDAPSGWNSVNEFDDVFDSILEQQEEMIARELVPLTFVERSRCTLFSAYFVVRDIAAILTLAVVLWLLPMSVAYRMGRDSVQSANDLLDAGFYIADPEGFAVERFDDTASEKPDYWTMEPKGGEL